MFFLSKWLSLKPVMLFGLDWLAREPQVACFSQALELQVFVTVPIFYVSSWDLNLCRWKAIFKALWHIVWSSDLCYFLDSNLTCEWFLLLVGFVVHNCDVSLRCFCQDNQEYQQLGQLFGLAFWFVIFWLRYHGFTFPIWLLFGILSSHRRSPPIVVPKFGCTSE